MTTNELDARVASEVMGLQEVQMGHSAYWYNDANCGYTAESGPCHKDEGDRNEPAYVYRVRKPLDWRESGLGFVPDYTSDVADDYAVLCRVRETWDIDRHCDYRAALYQLLTSHGGGLALMNYQPGDYARAALAVLDAGRAV